MVLAGAAVALVAPPVSAARDATSTDDGIATSDQASDSPAAIARTERSSLGAATLCRIAGLILDDPTATTGAHGRSGGFSPASPVLSLGAVDTSLFSLHCQLAI